MRVHTGVCVNVSFQGQELETISKRPSSLFSGALIAEALFFVAVATFQR
jgi:hypothetical protein